MKKKKYVCTKIRVLTHLLSHGFEPITSHPDEKNPAYNVWIFVETPELRECVESYYSKPYFKNKAN